MSERQRNMGGLVTLACARSVAALLALGLAVVPGGVARADGAFPDAQAVLLPVDRIDEIVLATTFGLVTTEDAGATWSLVCENGLTTMPDGGMYALGAPPQSRLYAVSAVGAVVSADGGCTWTLGGGDLSSASPPTPFDVFPDPVDPSRVYLLAEEKGTPDSLFHVFRSLDGGLTYSGPLYSAPAGVAITGIESATSAPGTVYMTLHDVFPVRPKLGVSVDGGSSWTIRDIEGGIGGVTPMLAGVDPVDAARVYVRVLSAAGTPLTDGLAITADGGLTWTTPLTVPRGSLAGMARVSERVVVLVGTTAPPAEGQLGVPALFRSGDGGATFTTESLSFHPFGVALRQGTIFAATKDSTDGFALASSQDGGHTWTPRLRLREITRVKECVRAACQDSCDRNLAGLVFPPEVCNPPPPMPVPAPGGGCGCAVSPRREAWGAPAATAALILSLLTWMAATRPGTGPGPGTRRGGPPCPPCPPRPRRSRTTEEQPSYRPGGT